MSNVIVLLYNGNICTCCSVQDHHGLTVKLPSCDVSISHCLFSTRCAALSIGSEISGGVYNIQFKHNRIENCSQAFHIKTAEGRGGLIKDVEIIDCDVDTVKVVLRLNGLYRGQWFI